MQKIIVVIGPTASGKSDLAFKIAKKFNLEIISADAFQVYSELQIGVNKPSPEVLKKIKHHFINHKSINEEWNIKIFQDEVYQLLNSQKNYVMIGGSNLYIDSIIRNYDLKDLNDKTAYDNWTDQKLWEELNKQDSEEAKKIPVNNRRRLIQALKIINSRNQKKSSITNKKVPFKTFVVKTDLSRDVLYKKINERVLVMRDMGWEDEVKTLIKNGVNFEATALKAIGYKIIHESILTNTNVDWESIQQKTRRYAKQQQTWCKNKFVSNFSYNDKNDLINLFNSLEEFLNEK